MSSTELDFSGPVPSCRAKTVSMPIRAEIARMGYKVLGCYSTMICIALESAAFQSYVPRYRA